MGFSILSETLCCGFQFFARWTAASISICLSTALLVSENIDVKVLFTILKKWKFCPCIYLFICLSVCPSVITPYSFPFLSDSKYRRVTQPLPRRYPMSPIHVSHARPHSPVNWSPNEVDHLADLSSPI